MLEVKFLEESAKAPVVGHPGEDLGYDIFALEDTILPYGQVVLVRTGIAVAAYERRRLEIRTGYRGDIGMYGDFEKGKPLGLFIRDRSSMASKGVVTSGGVIDAGYRGEIKVLMTYTKQDTRFEMAHWMLPDVPYNAPYVIKAGEKIAQMVPVPILTGEVFVKDELEAATRGTNGFGSTGR